METSTSIYGQVMKKIGIKLPTDPHCLINCSRVTIYQLLDRLWHTVNTSVEVYDENSKALEEFTKNVAEWAAEQEIKIQEAIDGANQDLSSLTIGYNQLSGDVKKMLTNILLSQLSAEVTDRLLTAEMKAKIAGLKNYVLPKATQTSLGGVMVGTGLFVDSAGRISTTLDKLGMYVEDGKLKFSLIEDGKVKTYSVNVIEAEDAPQPEAATRVALYTSCGDVERDESGNAVGEYALSPIRRVVNAGAVNGFVAQSQYFALLVPENAILSSLTMNGAFGAIDLLAENDFIPTDDYIVDGVVYHVYLYHMPVASEENPVKYEFVVSNI